MKDAFIYQSVPSIVDVGEYSYPIRSLEIRVNTARCEPSGTYKILFYI